MIAPMIGDLDHQAEAIAAMQKAIAATCPAERLKWLRTALAWKDLASWRRARRQPEGHSQPLLAAQDLAQFSIVFPSAERRTGFSNRGHRGSQLTIHRMCGWAGRKKASRDHEGS